MKCLDCYGKGFHPQQKATLGGTTNWCKNCMGTGRVNVRGGLMQRFQKKANQSGGKYK